MNWQGHKSWIKSQHLLKSSKKTFKIHYEQLLKISRSQHTSKKIMNKRIDQGIFPFWEKKSYSKIPTISTSLSLSKFWLLIQFLWPYKVKILVSQKFFTHFQQFPKECWRQQFKKIFFQYFHDKRFYKLSECI